MVEKPLRQLPLRELLAHTEKCTRDLAGKLRSDLGPRLHDLGDLSRLVRQRTRYPSLAAVVNGLANVMEAEAETDRLARYLEECWSEIHQHCRLSLGSF